MLFQRIADGISGSAARRAHIANADGRVIDHPAVPPEHASRDILGRDEHPFIRLRQDPVIFLLILQPPARRLFRTGNGQDQPRLRMRAPEGEHRLGGKGVEAQRAAADEKADFPVIIQKTDDLLQPLPDERHLTRFDRAVAGKAGAEFHLHQSIFSTARKASLGT